MSRKSWTEVIEDMIAKIEEKKQIHKDAIRRHEDIIVALHNEIRANRRDLEESK